MNCDNIFLIQYMVIKFNMSDIYIYIEIFYLFIFILLSRVSFTSASNNQPNLVGKWLFNCRSFM